MNSALVAGLLAGWGIAVPVGAVAAYLVGLTARSGPRVGAAAALGVASADGVYALIAVVGGVALTGVISAIATPLRWVSVVVLVLLGARIIWSAVSDHRTRTELTGPESVARPGRAYVTLLGITLLNPQTILYFAALVVGSTATAALDGSGPVWLSGAVFVLAAFCASASWQLVLVGGGVALGHALTGHSGRLITGLVSGALIIAFAAALLLAG
ncbi:LysE family transporter [Nakamurella sp.]|uniref:LysE family transporter n=1 Tax=Nakamurella sp. TaxID=1869182 RepID=UPI0037850FBC